MKRVTTRLRSGAAIAGAAVLALGFTQSAMAQPVYDANGAQYYAQSPGAYRGTGRPLTVNRRYQPAPVIVAPTYDPYAGPQAIVTAPLAAASTLVALPFRVINGVFPPYGNPAANPLVLVGAPVHAAGQIAQVPFRILQAPFEGSAYPTYPTY